MSTSNRIFTVCLLVPMLTIVFCFATDFYSNATCARCGQPTTRARARAYSARGKPDIVLCPECHYAQAESFLKFCPVDE